MPIFTSIPHTIDAMQWTGDNIDELMEWAGPQIVNYPTDQTPKNLSVMTTDDVEVPVPVGHYVVREPLKSNRFYPVDPEVMARKYRPGNHVAPGEGS